MCAGMQNGQDDAEVTALLFSRGRGKDNGVRLYGIQHWTRAP